jgi:hypothetical protein
VSRVDMSIRAAAAVTVVALAGIAGAISYSHMRQLAAEHGEVGWRTHAFPLSVDGIEIVASLVLLADRRAGRESGWLPWTALTAGTAASMAANVAVAGSDPIGRVVAGWPAFALIVAIKLLSGLLESRPASATVPDRPATAEDRPSHQGRARTTGEHHERLADRRSHGGDNRPPAGHEPGTGSADAGTVPGAASDIDALLPIARVARDRLLDEGRPVTRDTLAAQLRQDGHAIRNARLSALLSQLKAEPGTTPTGRR